MTYAERKMHRSAGLAQSAVLQENADVTAWYAECRRLFPNGKGMGIDFRFDTESPDFSQYVFNPAYFQLQKQLKKKRGVERRRSFVKWVDEKGPAARLDVWYEANG